MTLIEGMGTNAENAKEPQAVQLKIKREKETSEALKMPEKVSDYPTLYPAKNVPLTADIDEGYVEFEDKKVPMFRGDAIEKAFNDMGIEIKEAKNEKEATQYMKELFGEYEADFPEAFTQDNWCEDFDNTKFELFDKRATDKGLDYAGYNDVYGNHTSSDTGLYGWLPIHINDTFVCFGSTNIIKAAKCFYGGKVSAMPITNTFSRPDKNEK